MGFSEQLRKLREKQGLTQGEVAERAKVPFRSYQNWELGIREPRLPVLPSLAKALGVDLDELLEGVDKPARAKPGRRKGK